MNDLNTRYPNPEQSPGLMLWRASNAWQRTIRAALAPHGLTQVQFVLLATLVSAGSQQVTQRELAEAAVTDAMMTSQLVRTLEKKRLLERHPHPTDRRAIALTPTSAGRDVVNVAILAVESADEAFFSTLGSGQVSNLTGLLNALSRAH